ncbi:metallophosphoesterase [Flavobacterium zepuense]|uniref:Metallophosphoesterase n=1 Tax=Flavobacterium zepuense TaxID=2593302 RepID=A0A552V7U5_9FLAO|nr:metallophosphoesterase [Flavobacterium zepuense]TRW26527.1 metallophosphoesterase [Flavobacterium zepuense]
MRRFLIFLLIVALIAEIYTFQAVKAATKTKWVHWVYLAVSILVILYIIYSFTQFDRREGQNKQSLFTMGLLLITVVPKLVITIVMLGEDIIRVLGGFIRMFMGDSKQPFLSERRRFVSLTALGLAAMPFLSLLYGMTKGKYNFKVIRQTITFPDLPDNFDGFTITQISDVHSGSFDNKERIQYAIDLINEQKTDIILFTGDIVNTHAREMYPWIETFKGIKTPEFGKYSILGNHDYGEYIDWPTQKEKDDNFAAIKDLHRQIDFKLMLNEHIKIKKGDEEIALVGLENWGHNFKKAGDLKKASEGLTPQDFKILMSHDPSHWEYEVKNHPGNYHLTLSGHTHGLQFGIEIPGLIKWSPVQYVYKQWAGLYENIGRYVYVNRGFGFHAYPGRVGIWPEITVLELKKG